MTSPIKGRKSLINPVSAYRSYILQNAWSGAKKLSCTLRVRQCFTRIAGPGRDTQFIGYSDPSRHSRLFDGFDQKVVQLIHLFMAKALPHTGRAVGQ